MLGNRSTWGRPSFFKLSRRSRVEKSRLKIVHWTCVRAASITDDSTAPKPDGGINNCRLGAWGLSTCMHTLRSGENSPKGNRGEGVDFANVVAPRTGGSAISTAQFHTLENIRSIVVISLNFTRLYTASISHIVSRHLGCNSGMYR